MENKKVIISGIGAISSWGIGIEALRDGLLKGTQEMVRLDNKYIQSCNVKLAFSNSKLPNSCLDILVDCINEALQMAKFPETNKDTALVIGTGAGRIELLEEYIFDDRKLSFSDLYNEKGNLSHILAKKYGITSLVSCISTGCSSSNYAIAYAKTLIQLGKCKRVICCGVEVISTIVINCFNKMNGIDPKGIKPFDKNRSGSTAGIGAGVLIIETEAEAIKRNKVPLAELGGFGYSCDSFNIIAPEPNGKQAIRAMKTAMNESQISSDEIAAIFAHGTGTKLNDVFEASSIKAVFGDCYLDIPIIGMKGSVGHTGGASNILAACAAILAFQENLAFRTPGTVHIDKDCELNITLCPQPINKNAIMINGFAFGGNNASIILKRYVNENTNINY